MKKLSNKRNNYNIILINVINHIEQSKLRAFSEVNKALLYAYWNIGRELSKNSSYGKSVVEQLSRDLRLKYPEAKGYSVANLWNMKRFYETYNQKLQTVAGESGKLQPLVAEFKGEKLQVLPVELLFKVSWTNHLLILDKTSLDEENQKVYI